MSTPFDTTKRAVSLPDEAFKYSFSALNLRQRIIKRTFDIFFAILALLILIVPMLVLAALVKLESPGPILFRQTRIGFGNRLFCIWKFRSMTNTVDVASKKIVQRSNDSQRLTRIGKFLRTSSADELPQLMNVLRGEMSIVGPRPHAVESTAGSHFFWELDPRYWDRHRVKPGLTGLAQVRGYLGQTKRVEDLTGRLKLDLLYIEDWSLLLDFKIIIATIAVVVSGQDAAKARRQ